jgi:chromosome segregation ATPase
MAGVTYACPPWGPVDVPHELVSACKSRGLPLDIVAVPPETRAIRRVAEEKTAHQKDGVIQLNRRAEAAEAETREARRQFEQSNLELSATRDKFRRLEVEAEGMRGEITALRADKEAGDRAMQSALTDASEAEKVAIRRAAAQAQAAEESATQARQSLNLARQELAGVKGELDRSAGTIEELQRRHASLAQKNAELQELVERSKKAHGTDADVAVAREETKAARAAENAAKSEIETALGMLKSVEAEREGLEKRLALVEEKLRAALADKEAAEQMMNDEARKSMDAAERAAKAEAMLKERDSRKPTKQVRA